MRVVFLVFLLIFSLLEATEEVSPEFKEGPWFTGTLLAPVTSVLQPGYLDIETYVFALDDFGRYNSHWHAHSTPSFITVSPLLFMQAGLFPRVDFRTFPQLFYQSTQGRSSFNFGDLPVGLDFLITGQEENGALTAIFSIVEIFPTGRYQKLNPRKHLTDSTGGGAFGTQFSLALIRLFKIGDHYLNTYLTLQDTIFTSTHVKGFNTYGGGFGTNGRVHPGNLMTAIFSMEYSLTKHWALALDILNAYSNKSHFSGRHGVDAQGVKAKVGTPSADQLSLAPAVEYSFSDEFGLIAGAWFSVAGRNSPQFAGGVIAFNWYGNLKN